jgi:hypothetical protein
LDQQTQDEINAVLQLAERKPKVIEALLQERRDIDTKLVALGYVAPKRTRKSKKTEVADGSKKRTGKTA